MSTLESEAFHIEYQRHINESSLRNDVESYLGEYRFQLPSYDYHLIYSGGHLRDTYFGEPMINKGVRAEKRRENTWRNANRERAELQGLRSLDETLKTAMSGDCVIWASPPGPKKDGYGDYGFIFLGKILEEEGGTGDNKHLAMTAYRVESPELWKFNLFLREMTDLEIDFHTAGEFLSSPFVLPGGNKTVAEIMLERIFGYCNDSSRQSRFDNAMHKLRPHIDKFITMVKQGSPRSELKKVFNAIENYSLDESSPINLSFDNVLVNYNYHPPVTRGSCGSTGGKNSFLSGEGILRRATLQDALSSQDDLFICPACNAESIPPVGKSCPKCHITKEEAQEKGLITC